MPLLGMAGSPGQQLVCRNFDYLSICELLPQLRTCTASVCVDGTRLVYRIQLAGLLAASVLRRPARQHQTTNKQLISAMCPAGALAAAGSLPSGQPRAQQQAEQRRQHSSRAQQPAAAAQRCRGLLRQPRQQQQPAASAAAAAAPGCSNRCWRARLWSWADASWAAGGSAASCWATAVLTTAAAAAAA